MEELGDKHLDPEIGCKCWDEDDEDFYHVMHCACRCHGSRGRDIYLAEFVE